MRNFIDSFMNPAIYFLSDIKENLLRFSIDKNKPIDLDSFFGPFALLSPEWVMLVKAVMVSVFSITFLMVAIGLRGVYLYFKDSVKWW